MTGNGHFRPYFRQDTAKFRFRIKTSFILGKFNKSPFGSGKRSGSKSKVFNGLRRLGAPFLLSIMALYSLFSVPSIVNAGFVSFISSMFFEAANSQQPEAIRANSQNIELLEATHGPKPSQGNGEIAIVDETALESQGDVTEENVVFPHSDQISVYVVRKGDTLSQIAKMYGVTTNTILWANDIKDGVLSEGQTLTILPISGVRHLVKKGETIESIAKQHGGDLNEVLQFNGISIDTKLVIGDEVIVPNGEVKTDVATKGSTQSSTKTKVTTKSVPEYTGYYMRPITGGRKSQGIHGYNGVDLANSVGTPVMAAAEGTVIVAKNTGWNGGYGKYVVISHPNGTQTLYAHLNQGSVFVGQRVTKGQVIGSLGSTGNSTGPHVHFEIRGAKNPF